MGLRLFLILIAAAGVHAAGDSALDRATLRGIEAVNVVVDPVDPQVESAGVTRADLRARVETRLRSKGMMVDTSRPEFLAVRMTLAHSGRGPFAMYAVALTLGLYQPVELVRDAKVRTATQTWEVETVILSAPKSLDQAVLDSIDDLTDRFVKAHRSVNEAP
jgi:hypothetical protein